MSKKHLITKDEATMIEKENALVKGTFAYDRPATAAEIIYLKDVMPISPLSFHLEVLPGIEILVIVEPDPGACMESYVEKYSNLVCFARTNADSQFSCESFALTISNKFINSKDNYSISVNPNKSRNVFKDAPRKMLLCPTFALIPPTEYEESSPGVYIKDLSVREVLHVNHLILQDLSTLINISLSSVDEFFEKQKNLLNN